MRFYKLLEIPSCPKLLPTTSITCKCKVHTGPFDGHNLPVAMAMASIVLEGLPCIEFEYPPLYFIGLQMTQIDPSELA